MVVVVAGGGGCRTSTLTWLPSMSENSLFWSVSIELDAEEVVVGVVSLTRLMYWLGNTADRLYFSGATKRPMPWLQASGSWQRMPGQRRSAVFLLISRTGPIPFGTHALKTTEY
jgi:hypothetical protein